MPKRVLEIAKSIKQISELQVNEWDFMALMNTNLNELEISRSLKRLADVHVMDWDFRTVLPAVKRTANQEVDVIGLLKRTASYKVMDWDFRKPLPAEIVRPAGERRSSRADLPEITLRLRNFLQYVAVNLIDEPEHAEIKAIEIGPNVLRFKLILVKRDLAMLIGREGNTAAAIRNVLKAAGEALAVHVLLQIHSHEDEAAQLAKAAQP
jgi:uncharacterized protein